MSYSTFSHAREVTSLDFAVARLWLIYTITIHGLSHFLVIDGRGSVENGLEELSDEVEKEEEEKLSVESFSISLGIPVVKYSIGSQCTRVNGPE